MTWRNERDFLIKRIQDMRPWGDFTFPSLQEMGNQRLWFYVVPHKDLPKFEMAAPVREIIRRDNRFCYVAVVAEKEPSEMPVARVHLGSKPRHELEARLDDVELAIEDAQAERAYLTRWHDLLRHDLNRLEDQAVRQSAAAQIYSNDQAFALQGWAPDDSLPALKALFERTGILLCSRSAHSRRQPAYTHAQSIVAKRRRGFGYFLHDPGYQTWDPSAVTFVSFVIFFAMILADAGYAAILGIVLMLMWKKLGRSSSGSRFRPLLLSVVVASLGFWSTGRQLFRRNPVRGVLAWKAPYSEGELIPTG